MTPITLSKSKIKNARRLGGVELLVLWNDEHFGTHPALRKNTEDRANQAQRRTGRQLVAATCKQHHLSVIEVRIVNRHRPATLAVAAGEHRIHLSIHIVADDWTDKTVEVGRRGIEMFHEPPGRPATGVEKQDVMVRLTPDAIAWFRALGGGGDRDLSRGIEIARQRLIELER